MKDRFSKHANQYAQFRPTYPPELYDFIYQHVQNFDAAWDCGTGNGQAARDVSKKFKKVFATDISAMQIARAYQSHNISYSIANENTFFEEDSFDLVTVAQAAHWFDMKTFTREVIRVSKQNSIIALWGYGLLSINPAIDILLNRFYTLVIGGYWDKERCHIDEHYKNLYFPFQEIEAPAFTISVSWTKEELEGYITTWSAVQKFIARQHQNPVSHLISEINSHWKDDRQTINFPIFLKIGRIKK